MIIRFDENKEKINSKELGSVENLCIIEYIIPRESQEKIDNLFAFYRNKHKLLTLEILLKDKNVSVLYSISCALISIKFKEKKVIVKLQNLMSTSNIYYKG